jgi:hypothetical protein
MNASNYLEQKIAEHTLGIAAFTMPASLFIELHTADPTEVGNVAPVSGGSYVRKAATFQWDGVNGWGENVALIRWDDLPAATITHISIKDAVSAGNTLYYGALTASRTVGAGGSFEIAAQALTITVA